MKQNLWAPALAGLLAASSLTAQIPNPFGGESHSVKFHSVVCRNTLKLARASGYGTDSAHVYEFLGRCALADVTKVTKEGSTTFGSFGTGGYSTAETIALVDVAAKVTWDNRNRNLVEGMQVMTAPYAGQWAIVLSCPNDPITAFVPCTGIQVKNTTNWDGFDFFWARKQPVTAGLVTPALAIAMSIQSQNAPKPGAPPLPPDPTPTPPPTHLPAPAPSPTPIPVPQTTTATPTPMPTPTTRPGVTPAAIDAVAEAASRVVELEAYAPSARVTEGQLGRQVMSGFRGSWGGGAQLLWAPGQAGAQLRLMPNVVLAGRYRVTLVYTRAPDYGMVRVSLAGQPAGQYDGYAPAVSSDRLELGTFDLTAAPHELLLTVTGRSRMSSNFLVGLDRLELEKVVLRQ